MVQIHQHLRNGRCLHHQGFDMCRNLDDEIEASLGNGSTLKPLDTAVSPGKFYSISNTVADHFNIAGLRIAGVSYGRSMACNVS